MSFRQVFRHRDFALMWTQRLVANIAIMMNSVTIGWQVYTLARRTLGIEESSLLLGLVGLAQFVPFFFFSLVAGESVDRYNRRKIFLFGIVIETGCVLALLLLSLQAAPSLIALFALAALLNLARAFLMPASMAMVPMLVPASIMPKAVGWSSLAGQLGRTAGPWIGGVLCAVSPALSYGVAVAGFVIAWLCIFLIRAETDPPKKPGADRIGMIREGLAYLWSDKIVLGAISLDLFAVFMGGVTALLPAYARDILEVGATGFGYLRAAPAFGGMAMLGLLSFLPIRRRAGPWMLGAVVVYGIGTVIFAVSKDFNLALAMLVLLGASDSISVFVRQTLVQVVTPDHMRGRIAAVSSMFISASNELGEFESGVAARLLGPVGSALFGGIASIVIAGLWAKLFPDLRKADRLETRKL